MKSLRYLFVFTACFFLVSTAHAAVVNTPYIGGKIGLMMPDGSGIDDATNLGIVLGLPLKAVQGGTVAVEGELTTTIADGDIAGGGEWDVMTLGGYGVYRSTGQLFFKGKAGLVYWDADFDFGPFVSGSDDDISLSVGIGGGYQISNRAGLELEYTILDSDLDFLSIGFVMNF